MGWLSFGSAKEELIPAPGLRHQTEANYHQSRWINHHWRADRRRTL